MEILSFFSRSVPCKKNVRPRDITPYPGKEEYSLVDGTFFRTSKNGNLVISGEDVNRVGYADDELVTLLKQKSFSLNGYPSYLIENLRKLALIKPGQTSKLNYHEHHVADNRLPYYARLEITDNCQCACTFCYKKEQKMQDPSLEILKRRIRRLKELGIVRLEILGGEPFIRKDITELCNFIAEENMLYTITTNGEYIKNLSEAQLNALRTAKNITISLDSYGKYHDEGRKREGLFDAVIQGIRILKEKNIPVSIISTINTNNIAGLEQLITFMEPYCIPHTIRPTILSGEAKNNNLQNLSMKEILENHKDNKYLRHTTSYLGRDIDEAKYYGCDFRHLINIDVSGKLLTCEMDRTEKMDNFELLTPESLIILLENELTKKLSSQNTCSQCKINAKTIRCAGFCKFSKVFAKNQIRERE